MGPAASKFAKNKNDGFGSQRKRDVKEIDDEIESMENQIKRLSKRIEAFRLEKVERIALEKCRGGRIVASKFMEPKTKQNAVVPTKKDVETLKSKDVNSRQGASFQPAKMVSRVAPPQPPRKLLFKEREKSVSESNKKGGLKEGRVVGSRYKNYSEANKRSLPESHNGSEVVRVRKRWEITSTSEVVNAIRKLQHGGDDNESNNGSEVVRVRKRWEITSPSEVVNAIRKLQHGGDDNESNNGSEVVRVRKRWEITSPSEVVNAIRKLQHGGDDNESNNGSEVVRVKKRWEIPSPSKVVNWIIYEIFVFGN